MFHMENCAPWWIFWIICFFLNVVIIEMDDSASWPILCIPFDIYTWWTLVGIWDSHWVQGEEMYLWLIQWKFGCFDRRKNKRKKKKKQSHINEMWQLNVSELMAFKAFNFFQICCLLSSSAFMSMGQLCRPLPGLSFCSFSNIFGSFLL